MMRTPRYLCWLLLLLPGCIGDDFVLDTVEASIRILNPVDTLELNTTYDFEFAYFNNVGAEEMIDNAVWSSSDPAIIAIDAGGLAEALTPGEAVIKVEAVTNEGTVMDEQAVVVGNNTSANARSGMIRTTSSYTLEGDFTLSGETGNLLLSVAGNYRASSNLPGLYLYLTNNPNSVANALEIGKVTVFNGAHTYTITGNVGLNDYDYLLYYCKPFNVKVGDGEMD